MPAARTTRTSVHRVVLVPTSPISSRDRGDDAVRRYRLARLCPDEHGTDVWLASPRVDLRAVQSAS